MARPVWNGSISFGLLNVPVQLYSGERSVDLHLRMRDSRTNTRGANRPERRNARRVSGRLSWFRPVSACPVVLIHSYTLDV